MLINQLYKGETRFKDYNFLGQLDQEILITESYTENLRSGISLIEDNSIISADLSIGDMLSEFGYSFEGKQLRAISEFLSANPILIDDLRALPSVVPSYFPDSQLILSLYTDTEEEYCVLNILIGNKLPVDVAFNKERQLFKRYFRAIYKKHKGIINIKETSII
ncbi:hypothetical protein [Chitinophaga sp. S165]|uniref:hypothetical protein n=1 Tax=Chitinophaga sp. S165 TaxID=2135462 RepID=UPI000D711DB2|nr:hypothetical protein [Chitinophaga sp. S165]PWV53516.1 hypothetical protein C7475_102266 [Chitinophaga sp. S165]